MDANHKNNSSGLRNLKRFYHIGPITTILIIKSITIQTLYLNSMWYPPQSSIGGFINQTIFIVLSALTAFNFFMAAIVGPGWIPYGWKPKEDKDVELLQLCSICPDTYKAPRAHHCRKCDRCIIKMDHHCPYINNCIGQGNHAHFTFFLIFAVIGCSHAAFILIAGLYRGLYRDYYVYYGEYSKASVKLGMWSLILTVFNIGLAVGVVIAVGMLLYFQLRAIIRNRTGIEDWILDKAVYRRNLMTKRAKDNGDENFQTTPFVYPYDLGWKKNFKQVLNIGCNPVGDGITWPVVEGCDQFTLTREQLAQKADKRARTRTYRIISKVSGSWMPLMSQGIKVCIHPPLTDESRIPLDVGDVVNVTRWRRHWLFGEKVETDIQNNNKSNGNTEHVVVPRKRIRGWFPRQCSAEFINDNDDDDDDDCETQEIVHLNSHKKVN